MPDTFEPVTACTYNQRTALLSFCTVMKCSNIITQRLKSVKKIIDVLYFCNRTKSAHRHTKSLPNNSQFTDSGIKNSFFTIFGLKSGETLVHIAYVPKVFTKCKHFWICSKELIKIMIEYFKTIYHGRLVRI